MKKFIALFLVLIMMISSLASCAKVPLEESESGSESYSDFFNGGTNSNDESSKDETPSTDKSDDSKLDSEVDDDKDSDDKPIDFTPPTNASVYSGTPDTSWYTGDKTEYILKTADQLAGLNKIRQDNKGTVTFEGITIKLAADMIMNPGKMESIVANGDSNKPFPLVDSSYPFEGTFDGQGHIVSGVYIKSAETGNKGMLGSLGGNAVVKNLKLYNAFVTCPTAKDKSTIGTLVANIAGDNANVTISNVIVHSTVKEAGYETAKVGGIVGLMSTAGTLTMDNCDFYGSVTTTGRSAGGILGSAINLKGAVNLTNCKNHGNVTANVDAGGLIGTSALNKLNYEGSSNKGTIKSPVCKGELIGYISNAPVGEKAEMRSEQTSLRVMSFNHQADYDFTNDVPSEAGKNRMAAVQQEIQLYSPDIVAVQEDYARVLKHFTLVGYTRISPSSLTTGMSNCSIFYKNGITKKTSGSKYVTSDGTSDTVALTAADVRTGDYKLTSAELKELGITSSTTNKQMRNLTTKASGTTKLIGPKQVTWGVFSISGKEVICVNVHLQHRSQNAAYSTPAVQKLRLMERLKQLAMTQDQINKLKKTYTSAEVIIMGDFNDLVGSQTYLELRDKYGYSSAHEVAAERYGVSATWNNAFKSGTQGATYPSAADRSSNSMLDFCFVSSGLQVLKFRVGAGSAPHKYQTYLYTSDHLPIITDLYFGKTIPTVNTTPSEYSGKADDSWYDANNPKTSYVLTTADQFVGLNKIRKEQGVTFEGVTIKLGADIVINEGTLDEIKANGTKNKTLYVTGSDTLFKGTFDGQGHSISGVYFATGYSYRAIFGAVGGKAVIKNFILENSYFKASTEEGKTDFGMIVGLVTGSDANVTLSNIIIASTVLMEEGTYTVKYVGGFVGRVSKGTLTMNNCHLNGKVYFPNSECVAGLVGLAVKGTKVIFNSCHGTGSVTCKNKVAGLSIIDESDDTLNKNNKGSCLTGYIKCTSGTKYNASFIKVTV
ncbi:MAG: hypothetical protein E7678_01755 [Ruminococcaceae bacterium]|nr:hypothetical protein [Oscillospiraceae bacterium]